MSAFQSRSILATLIWGNPHEQMTAAAVLGEQGRRRQAPLLVPLLSSEYPLARFYARAAIERLVHGTFPIDLDGDPETVQRTARAWLYPVYRMEDP